MIISSTVLHTSVYRVLVYSSSIIIYKILDCINFHITLHALNIYWKFQFSFQLRSLIKGWLCSSCSIKLTTKYIISSCPSKVNIYNDVSVLWQKLTSHDKSDFNHIYNMSINSHRLSTQSCISYIRHIYSNNFRKIRALFCVANSSSYNVIRVLRTEIVL